MLQKPLIGIHFDHLAPLVALAALRTPNFDISTPYFAGRYELAHLPVPKQLQANVAYKYYPSGHMVYVNPTLLSEMHSDVAAFIRRTDGVD